MAANVNDPTGAEARKRIWIVFGILSLITALEFGIAFVMGAGNLRTGIFLGLTVVKAFYIVADFMHLKHEVKGLIISVVLPGIFLFWFILSMMIEGTWYMAVPGDFSWVQGGWFKYLAG